MLFSPSMIEVKIHGKIKCYNLRETRVSQYGYKLWDYKSHKIFVDQCDYLKIRWSQWSNVWKFLAIPLEV